MSPKDLRPTADKPPKGWLTARQWATRWSLSPPHAIKLLRDGISSKKVIVKNFRVQSGARLMPVPHYRAK